MAGVFFLETGKLVKRGGERIYCPGRPRATYRSMEEYHVELEEMSVFFENRLDGYDEHMRATIEGASAFYAYTAAQLPAGRGARVLDLGCGTGLELEEYFALTRTRM